MGVDVVPAGVEVFSSSLREAKGKPPAIMAERKRGLEWRSCITRDEIISNGNEYQVIFHLVKHPIAAAGFLRK